MKKTISLGLVLVLVFAYYCDSGYCRDVQLIKMKKHNTLLGGLKPSSQNSAEIESIARFAVLEHNKKQNSLLQFARVVKAKEQVVAGTMYHLTLEAIDSGKKHMYEAKVWVKPWMNFKQLEEFKSANDVPVFTSSDLGVIRGH
ncbi:cysteine proteinase inhibitor A isoform X3 [Daucus carota subsp. sativus]|uniref:cysteine proteinase inhibitor A isoform X3 n=1 Tax=Daucus carota subsp. sativus TaxID=79200 RepID=UPI0007EFF377|nr:PREDICTED: cysteine proteinase inhibitor A [Daucus carota subsp. sativus]